MLWLECPSLPVTLQGVKCKVRACERKYKL
jgi:hypothetical protein